MAIGEARRPELAVPITGNCTPSIFKSGWRIEISEDILDPPSYSVKRRSNEQFSTLSERLSDTCQVRPDACHVTLQCQVI